MKHPAIKQLKLSACKAQLTPKWRGVVYSTWCVSIYPCMQCEEIKPHDSNFLVPHWEDILRCKYVTNRKHFIAYNYARYVPLQRLLIKQLIAGFWMLNRIVCNVWSNLQISVSLRCIVIVSVL